VADVLQTWHIGADKHAYQFLKKLFPGPTPPLIPLLTDVLHILALPPSHLLRLLDQVVTHPARDGDDGHALLDEGVLPANIDQGVAHLIADLLEALLLWVCVCVCLRLVCA